MNRSRWQRVEAVVQEALDLPAEEREGFVAAACDTDPELRHEVETLLAACTTPEAAGEPGRIAPGHRRLGPYRLLRILGRGGTATVHLAERADGAYHGVVAIKVLRESAASSAAWRRFLAERQILSSLEHPNIARLLDAGTTADGRPYFVLEHVAGTPIDEYCDRHRLTVAERLGIFRTVCSAVHYAHQALVVHRDLKPSNILVTDGGEPKLLDFGIAKLLRPESFPLDVERTRTGGVPLTPAYASPEQLRGERITTASDVYALGVLLYLLLCGRLPHPSAGVAPAEAVERVLEREPPPPSRALAAAGDAARKGELRATQASVLQRQLAGDLDLIVAKALRKEPRRRYASAESLSEDLGRYGDGLPVRASPAGFGYLAGKFLRRHRVASAAAGAALAALISLTVGLMVVAADLREETLRAERSQRSTQRVLDTLIGVFTLAELGDGEGETITAGTLLDRGAERVAEQLSEEPAARAALDTALGEIYTHLGLYQRALPMLEQALVSRRALTGEDSLETAASSVSLARAYSGLGRDDEAERLLLEALRTRESILGRDHPEVAEALRSLFILYRDRNQLDRAREVAERALAIRERAFGPRDPRVAESLGELASLSTMTGDPAAAEPLMTRALEILEAAPGPRDRRLADAHTNLGILYAYRGVADRAAHHLHRAHELYRETVGEGHPATANALQNLALLYSAQGAPERAEPLMRQALAIFEGTVEPEHPKLAMVLGNLARLNLRLERLDRAEALYRRYLRLAEANLQADLDNPRKQLDLATAFAGLGAIAHHRGDDAEAHRRWLRTAELTAEKAASVSTHGSLHARALLRLGRTEQARPLVAELLAAGWREPSFLEACRRAGLLPEDAPDSYWGGIRPSAGAGPEGAPPPAGEPPPGR